MNSDRNESFCGGQEGGIIISKITSTPFKKQVDWRQKSIGVTSTRTKSVWHCRGSSDQSAYNK